MRTLSASAPRRIPPSWCWSGFGNDCSPNTLPPLRGETLPLSFSGGGGRRQEGRSQQEIIADADKTLYQSKHAGRRRIHRLDA
ncbi:MAG: hypothetical protein ACYDCX_03075 [Acidithiobacillus sp.]